MTSTHDARPELCLVHSPDPDDAFMWWALTPDETGRAPLEDQRFRFRTELLDIETSNARSDEAVYDITAISCAQYARVADRYAITGCGASMGFGYGPKLVARTPLSLAVLRDADGHIATPGDRTTAALVAGMALGAPASARFRAIPFDEVIERVAGGEFEAGIVIHEGQLTFQEAGLHLVLDLGAWWHERTQLPLPLGLNVIRRDLEMIHGPGTLQHLARLQRRSIDYALDHREQAVAYALRFARGLPVAVADEFVRLYVNDLTRDMGGQGRLAIQTLLAEAAALGLAPPIPPVDIIDISPSPVIPTRK